MESEGSCRVHKRLLLVPILSQIDEVHTIPTYLSKIHSNVVYPPTSRSPQWSLSFWLPTNKLFAFLFSLIQKLRSGIFKTRIQ
jgi:hypothetical protein